MSAKLPRGVLIFRLHPERDSKFHKGSQGTNSIRVLVFPDLASMRAYDPEGTDEQRNRHAFGWCTGIEIRSYRKGKRARRQPIVAEVVLHRQRLTTSIVTHELFHATIAYARHFVFNFCRLDARDSVNDQEEWLAHVHSNLCRLFMKRAIDAGLYTHLPVSRSVQHA
jgi:hypothetical protein